jgi:predicted nucleic acid-binding Zn ribbon protein
MGIEYEFKCPECDVSVFVPNKDSEYKHTGVDGAKHDAVVMKRVYSLGGITFKGSGFYKNEK